MDKWVDYSFIIRSKNRKKLIFLLDNPKTPSQLSSESDLHIAHVSRSLTELKEQGIVRLINPRQKTGRLYQLTPKGKKVLSILK